MSPLFDALGAAPGFAAHAGAVSQMARALRDAAPGTAPVGLLLDNGADWIAADLALLSLGRTCVPIPPFFTAAQRDAALADAGAGALILPGRIQPLPHLPVSLPAGTAKISYTSGSTGAPKGICISQAQMLATARGVIGRLGSRHAGRHLPLLPLGVLLENVAGLYASLLAGGQYAARPLAELGLANPFRPDFPTMVAAIAREQATSLILVPELLEGIVRVLEHSGEYLSRLTVVAVGGARVPLALLDRAAAAGLPVVQGYGLTEAGSVVAIEQVGETARGSVGTPLDHLNVEIAADGEIVVHGSHHLGQVGAEAPSGPLRTGDLGHLDRAGRLVVDGRKSNLIVTSFGRNVSPEWIEGLLLGQPGVAQAMVQGDGEPCLTALLVPDGPADALDAAVAAVNRVLPAYARIGGWRACRPFSVADGTLTANGRLRRAAIQQRETALPFFDRLVADTMAARARLLATPQLQAGLAGAITRETYIAYLAQAYHHVRHTVPLMREARAALGHRPLLAEALDAYMEEETGHEAWILADIAAAGGDAAAAAASAPNPATRAMVDHAYRTIREGNPVGLFGMIFVLEGTSIALAQQGADAVRTALGLPAKAFTYLVSHGALDQDHMALFTELVNRIDDPDDQAAIVAMANAMFDLYAGLFASIPMEAPRVAA